MTEVQRLLTEARKLIAAMDPQPGSGLDAVDELVHAALLAADRKVCVDRYREETHG